MKRIFGGVLFSFSVLQAKKMKKEKGGVTNY
jgi:hypothetical protein